MARIYLASSWRNELQPSMVNMLRNQGHSVYDFRNPQPGNEGFKWSEIDPGWEDWEPAQFRKYLNTHPIASHGFRLDRAALDWCDTCIMLLPCGKSAHLELAYACGRGKRTIICMPKKDTPELMYLFADHICLSNFELINLLEQ